MRYIIWKGRPSRYPYIHIGIWNPWTFRTLSHALTIERQEIRGELGHLLGVPSTAVKRPKRFSFYLVGFYLMLSGNMGKDV